MADSHETEPLAIAEAAREESRLLLEEFLGYAESDPDLLKRVLHIYDHDPAQVDSLATFIHNNAEGFAEVVSILKDEPNGPGILRTVTRMFDARADADLAVPEELEQMIMNDPEYKVLMDEARKMPGNEARGKLRRRFVIKLMGHTAAA